MRLLLLLLTAAVAFAGWEDVQRVSPDRRIEVVMREGKRLRGTFVSASETVLVLRSKSGEHSISRGDIRRVRIADPLRRVRSVLIGAVIGAGAGLAIGAAVPVSARRPDFCPRHTELCTSPSSRASERYGQCCLCNPPGLPQCLKRSANAAPPGSCRRAIYTAPH